MYIKHFKDLKSGYLYKIIDKDFSAFANITNFPVDEYFISYPIIYIQENEIIFFLKKMFVPNSKYPYKIYFMYKGIYCSNNFIKFRHNNFFEM